MKRSRRDREGGPLVDYARLCGTAVDWALMVAATLGLAGFALAAATLLWLALKR